MKNIFQLLLLTTLLFTAGCTLRQPPPTTPDNDFVRQDQAGQAEPAKPSPPQAAPPSPGESIVQTALSQIGRPYAWGGTDPGTGFDCSGLVRWVYGRHGLDLPRSASEQSRLGSRVPLDKHRAGDLIFFRTSGRTSNHVGIATGRGTFIHSPKPGDRVREESLRISYWRQRLTSVRRII